MLNSDSYQKPLASSIRKEGNDRGSAPAYIYIFPHGKQHLSGFSVSYGKPIFHLFLSPFPHPKTADHKPVFSDKEKICFQEGTRPELSRSAEMV